MQSRRKLKLALSGLVAVLLFTAAAVQPASAHPVNAYANFQIGNLCVISASQIKYNHTPQTSSAFATTTARLSGGSACDTIDMYPPGYLLARVDVQRWGLDSQSQQWRWLPCRTTGWVSNTTWADHVEASASFGATYPVCDAKYPQSGPGYFRAHGFHFVKVGSDWKGGETSTGHHYMPQ